MMRITIATLSCNLKAMTNYQLAGKIIQWNLWTDGKAITEGIREQIRTVTRALTVDIDLHHNE